MCSALLWWLAGHGASGVAGIYAVLVLYGCARAFSGPAMQSLLPQIVPRGQLAQAIAANSMLMRVASIGGPLLGGLLYALGGGELTYAVCCACFVLGVALLLRVVRWPMPLRPAPRRERCGERFGAGITFIRTRPIILGTISLDLFCRAAGRRGGPAAHLRARGAACGPGGPGRAAQRHGRGRGERRAVPEHAALQPPCGAHHVHRRGGVWRGQPGVCALAPGSGCRLRR